VPSGLQGDTLEAAGLLTPPNLDLARSIFAAWERGDFTTADWAHPEIEYVFADGPSPGTWKGLAGMAEAWSSFLKAWEQFHPEVEEFRELDDKRIVALLSFRGRGKTSGLDLGQMRAKGAGLMQIENAKVTRMVFYLNRDRAFAELGLPSEASDSS
jgi:ketosteroid isomerase-like protein